jgi:CubicO group peptidase (beta-lactamase class C family)
VAVARDGELVAFEAFGQATTDNRYVIFSCTKGITAGAIWLLVERGQLSYDTVVADVVPEFATNGKDAITVEQLLMHTAGFPSAPMTPPQYADLAERRSRFSAWRLNWEPGTKFEYHALSAHFVLGDLIGRLSGEDPATFVARNICEPLGMSTFALGSPPRDQADVLDVALVGELPTPDELEAALGIRIDLAELTGQVTADALLKFNQPDWRAAGAPGAGGLATAADLARLYQGFLRALDGAPNSLWQRDTVIAGVEPVNELPDPFFGFPAHRSRGLMVAGNAPVAQRRGGWGHGLSPRSFGHDGAGGQIAWADPESGLSFCYLTNGLDQNPLREGRRKIGLSSRAAALARTPQ